MQIFQVHIECCVNCSLENSTICLCFDRNIITEGSDKIRVAIPSLRPVKKESFKQTIEYIYTSKINLEAIDFDDLLDQFEIACYLQLDQLNQDVSTFLIAKLNSSNCVELYESVKFWQQNRLKEQIADFIDTHVEDLISEKRLCRLSSDSLVEIIGRDTFCAPEMDVFNLVQDWHTYNNWTNNKNEHLVEQIRLGQLSESDLKNITKYSDLINTNSILNLWLYGSDSKQRKPKPTTASTTSTTKKTIVSSNRLISAYQDRTIQIWNLNSGECIETLFGHTGVVATLELIAPNRLASGGGDNLIKIWNLETGECVRTLTDHKNSVWSITAITANQFASASWDRTIKVWNSDIYKCIRTLTGHTKSIWSMKVISAHRLASSELHGDTKVWNLDNGECIRTLVGPTYSLGLVEVISTSLLAVASGDFSLKIWNIEDGQYIRSIPTSTYPIDALRVLALSNRMVTGSIDRKVKIWNLDSNELIQELVGHTAPINSLESIDSNRLASGSQDGTIKIWNLDTGECIQTLKAQNKSIVRALLFIP